MKSVSFISNVLMTMPLHIESGILVIFFKQDGKFDPCFYISSRSLAFLNIFYANNFAFDMLSGSHVITVINIYLSLPSQLF